MMLIKQCVKSIKNSWKIEQNKHYFFWLIIINLNRYVILNNIKYKIMVLMKLELIININLMVF